MLLRQNLRKPYNIWTENSIPVCFSRRKSSLKFSPLSGSIPLLTQSLYLVLKIFGNSILLFSSFFFLATSFVHKFVLIIKGYIFASDYFWKNQGPPERTDVGVFNERYGLFWSILSQIHSQTCHITILLIKVLESMIAFRNKKETRI